MRAVRPMAAAVATCLACAAPASAQTPDRDGEGVRRAIRDYDAAWNRKDAAAFDKLLAPDYVYFTSKGAVWTKQRWLGLMLSPKYELESAQRSEIVVHLTGDTAMAGTRWQGHGSYDGKPFRDDQRCSLALRREAGAWQVLSEHCTQIVP